MGRSRAASLTVVLALALGTAAPAHALDLDGALAQVAAANPTLASRRAMAEAARRRVAPAGAWESPMVMLGVENVPVGRGFDWDPMTMKMVGVTQRVPLSGANRLARRSAVEAARGEAAAVDMALAEILGEAWQSYADAYYAGELMAHAEAHLGVMERLVGSARARYDAGRGRLDDLLRAESERARIHADAVTFQAERDAARMRLDALRGVSVFSAPEPLDPPRSVNVASDTAWSGVLAGHPRLREADARVARYRYAGRAARRTIWPDLEVEWSYGIREDLKTTSTAHGGTTTPVQDNLWSTSVGFTVPIFAGARELSEGKEMDAMVVAAEAERRAAELELRAQLAAGRIAEAAARRTVTLLADTVVATQQRAVDASWSAYTAGTADLWRTLEASHTLYSEQIALARARQQLAHAQARLLMVMGQPRRLGISIPSTRSEP
jgi:outer membrane protein TolC